MTNNWTTIVVTAFICVMLCFVMGPITSCQQDQTRVTAEAKREPSRAMGQALNRCLLARNRQRDCTHHQQ